MIESEWRVVDSEFENIDLIFVYPRLEDFFIYEPQVRLSIKLLLCHTLVRSVILCSIVQVSSQNRKVIID